MKLAAQSLPVSRYLPRNEYFLYALLLGYASARPRQSERAEQAFRKAYAKGIEANKHVLTALGRAVGRGRAAQIVKDLGIPSAMETELRAPRSARFYFNATTGESSWADPRQSVEFDLRLRHSILSECISAFRVLGLPDESSEGEAHLQHLRRDVALPQAFGGDLGELLGSLTLPLRHERLELPKAGVPIRPNVSAGDETGRTELSYLTARSTITEDCKISSVLTAGSLLRRCTKRQGREAEAPQKVLVGFVPDQGSKFRPSRCCRCRRCRLQTKVRRADQERDMMMPKMRPATRPLSSRRILAKEAETKKLHELREAVAKFSFEGAALTALQSDIDHLLDEQSESFQLADELKQQLRTFRG
eukprot:s2801_g11.t1